MIVRRRDLKMRIFSEFNSIKLQAFTNVQFATNMSIYLFYYLHFDLFK